MESLTSGTFVGAGSFRCKNCDYTLTLSGSDTLTDCPSCGGKEFVRASLFSHRAHRAQGTEQPRRRSVRARRAGPRARGWRGARERIDEPGEYLCYEDGGDAADGRR